MTDPAVTASPNTFCVSNKINRPFSLLQTFPTACFLQIQHVAFWHASCNYPGKTEREEDTNMKTTMTRQGAYIGAGAGLVLFALFGLLPGSLIGGAAGISFAGMLFGLPLEPGLVSRAIVIAGMVVGVLVSGIAIVTATSTIGWLAGATLGSTVREKTLAAAERR
jgi:hypothetical protein